MGQGRDAQQLEIAKLKELLRRQNVELYRERREKQALQNELLSQSQLTQSSSQSSFDVPSPVPGEYTTAPLEQQQDACTRRHSMHRGAMSGLMTTDSRHSQANVPRSSHHLQRDPGPHVVKRARTMSQQIPQSHQMDRSHSNLSSRSAGPFVGSTVTPPPKLNKSNLHVASSDMPEYYMSSDTPMTSNAYGHSMDRSQSTRVRLRADGGAMPTVTESVMMDPADFLATLPDEPQIDGYSCSMPIPHQQQFNVDMAPLNGGNISVCGSMTSAPTLETAPMTRENSAFGNQSVAGGVGMMSLSSRQGADAVSYGDSPVMTSNNSGDNSPLGKRPSPSDEDLLEVGSNLAPHYAQSYPAPGPVEEYLAAHSMERSVSSASMMSTKSNSSLKARAKETLQKQNQRSISTVLKPKPVSDPHASDSQSGNKKDSNKAAITKAKYVRPRQPKVYCKECDKHPEGFRGEHELRRHREAKHPTQGMVRKWICVDPISKGLPISVSVVNPLNKCKACVAQKKYGAYYNAAAHLRRTHFKEKPSRSKSKASNNNARDDPERRGGKGGGDWPPMSELKNWMEEIWVSKNEAETEEDEEAEDDSEINAVSTMDVDPIDITTLPQDYQIQIQKLQGGIPSDARFPATFPSGALMINTDVLSMGTQAPLSSADFGDFSGSPMNSSFDPYIAQSQMSQYGSVVSSTDTVTPMTGLNEVAANAIGDFQFDMIYPQ